MRVAVKRTLKGCLSTITRHPFAAQKTTSKQGREEKGKYPLLNDNLRFDANKYQLFLVPRHPQIKANFDRSLEVLSTGPVMQLLFLKKDTAEGKSDNIQQDFSQKIKQGSSIKLQFRELAKIIDINPGKNQKHEIQYQKVIEEKVEVQRYRMEDRPAEKKICFSLKNQQKDDVTGGKTKKEATLSYQDFQIIQAIIKESLFDLSGLRLTLDACRMDEVKKTSDKIRNSRKVKKESYDFYQKQ